MRALVAAIVLAACHHPAPPPRPSPSPHTEFGFYLLAMTWAPSFCEHQRCSQECAWDPKSRLTLHGLWPNYSDEQARGQPQAWPQYCGAYAHCEKAEDATCAPGVPVPPDLVPLAPSYVLGTLATHEWSKHGSCTQLSPAEFFRAELAAIHMIRPDALDEAIGHDLARDELQRAFGVPPASVVLGCDAQCRLTQVGFCIAKDAHDMPTAPIACSTSVTTSDYDNGCATHSCARVAIQAATACEPR